MPSTPRTIRWPPGLDTLTSRVAATQGISHAEFVRQATLMLAVILLVDEHAWQTQNLTALWDEARQALHDGRFN